jgi:glycosyltransferase involved in cell wall biosynthesis
MKLAIVIPYYRFRFFEATLESLANQTDQRFAVYIGDDASPESPNELLEKFAGKINFTYKKFEQNLGAASLTRQWERCIAMTSGEEFTMVLGDDDVLDKNCIAEFYAQADEIAQSQANVVRFATVIIDENGKVQSAKYEHPKLEKSTDFIHKKETKQTRSSLGEYFFKTDFLLEKGFWDFPLAWHSDDMAILQGSNFGNVFTINEAVVFIRVSDFSISGSESNVSLKKRATFEFYSALASDFHQYFSKNQRLKNIAKAEQYFYKHKSLKLFLKIARWHGNQNEFVHLLKFFRRALKNR